MSAHRRIKKNEITSDESNQPEANEAYQLAGLVVYVAGDEWGGGNVPPDVIEGEDVSDREEDEDEDGGEGIV
jgi:hypothetical protein